MDTRLVARFRLKLKLEWILKPSCDEHDHAKCYCTDIIVRTKPLKLWMAEKSQEHDLSNGELLLKQLLQAPGRTLNYHTKDEAVLKNSILVMSCLIHIEPQYGYLAPYFHDADITDDTFTKSEARESTKLRTSLYSMLRKNELDALLSDFDKEKWAFCPIILDEELLKGPVFSGNLKSKRFPFWKRHDLCGEGGQAKVRSVLVHEDFIENHELLKQKELADHDTKNGTCYRLAVKTYSSMYEHEFQAECNAFKGLSKTSGVIRYYGSFTHHDGQYQKVVCHYLVLEWAECNLYEFFKGQNPPVLPQEIVASWKTIAKGAETLRSVHKIEYGSGKKNGWHGDVKPENYLIVRGELKLTDFGFFAATDPTITEQRLRGKTKTYAPPEKGVTKQVFDTWSFGCILSIAATWITIGTTGVHNYERHRQIAHKQAFPEEETQHDQFHDGNDVYKAIRGWHNSLRTVMKHSDLITPRILDLIDRHLLVGNPKHRYTSEKLCEELYRIIDEAENFMLRPEQLALYQWAAPRLLDRLRQLIQLDCEHAFHANNWAHGVSKFQPSNAELRIAMEEFENVQTSLRMSEQYRLAKNEGHEGPLELPLDLPAKEGRPKASVRLRLGPTVAAKSTKSRYLNPDPTTSHRAEALGPHVVQRPVRSAPVDRLPPANSTPHQSEVRHESKRRDANWDLPIPRISVSSNQIPQHESPESIMYRQLPSPGHDPCPSNSMLDSELGNIPLDRPGSAHNLPLPLRTSMSASSDSATIWELVKVDSLKSCEQLQKLIVDSQINLAAQRQDGKTLIMIAAQELVIQNVYNLIPVSNIFDTDHERRTVLHHLVRAEVNKRKNVKNFNEDSFKEVLQLLLKEGSSGSLANRTDKNKHSALYYACESKDVLTSGTVEILIREMQPDDQDLRQIVLQQAVDTAPLQVLHALEDYVRTEDWDVNYIPRGGSKSKLEYIKRKVREKSGKTPKKPFFSKK